MPREADALRDWDDNLRLFGVPRSLLPEVRSSSETYGEARLEFSACAHCGIAGDQRALFGQVCHAPGMVKNTYGAGCFMLMNTGTKPIASRAICSRPSPGALAAGLSSPWKGASSSPTGREMAPRRSGDRPVGLAKVESLAPRACPTMAASIWSPAFAGLGAPHWDQYAQGLVPDLRVAASGGHIARAALEGIAFQVRDVLECVAMPGSDCASFA